MSVTIQTPEELRANVAAFKRMLGEKTVLHLIPEATMTQEQIKQAVHNAGAFDLRMTAKYTGEDGRTDYSVQNIADTYKFLRDNGMLKFEVAPVIRKQQLEDGTGKPVRDLRQLRKEEMQRQAEEAQAPHKTLESEMKRLESVAAVNRTIEATRAEIASFRGSSHSKTYAFRADATKILDKAIANDRTLGGIASAVHEIKGLMNEAWG